MGMREFTRCGWSGGWGEEKSRAQVFKISKLKVMDGAINAEMFKYVDLQNTRPKRPVVAADANGDDLLRTIVGYAFMTDFNQPGSEAVGVMTRCGFIPLGIGADGGDGNADTLYVLINEQNASQPATPYMPTEIYHKMTAVLAEKISRELGVARGGVLWWAIMVVNSLFWGGCATYVAGPALKKLAK